MIIDNSFDVFCLTETWLKPNYYFGVNESTPPSYCYKHEPRQTGRGGGVATIYSDILNVTQKTGYRFDSFEILMLHVTTSDMQKKTVLSLALATVHRPPGPFTDFLKELADFLHKWCVRTCVYWHHKLFWSQAKRHMHRFIHMLDLIIIAWN